MYDYRKLDRLSLPDWARSIIAQHDRDMQAGNPYPDAILLVTMFVNEVRSIADEVKPDANLTPALRSRISEALEGLNGSFMLYRFTCAMSAKPKKRNANSRARSKG